MLVFLSSAITLAAGQLTVASRAAFDKTVHEFGKVRIADGPVRCSFHVKNVGTTPLNINAVISSCGCTQVKWTRQTLDSGAEGSIDATFSNDEGPYPFDKTLTVYLSDIKKPVILHLRGESVK